MPARAPKTAKHTSAKTTRTPANPGGGLKTKASPGAHGGKAAGTRINAFVSSRGRRTQAKRDAR